MANEKNLKPNSSRTPDERRELAAKAGKASGEARRRKRDAQQAAKLILNLPALGNYKLNLESLGIPEEEHTNMAAVMARMLTKAVGSGDAKAARFLIDVVGGDAKNKLERERIKLEKERLEFERYKYEYEQGKKESSSDAVNEWIEAVMDDFSVDTMIEDSPDTDNTEAHNGDHKQV